MAWVGGLVVRDKRLSVVESGSSERPWLVEFKGTFLYATLHIHEKRSLRQRCENVRALNFPGFVSR